MYYSIFERLSDITKIHLYPIQEKNESLIPSNKTWQHVLTRIDYIVQRRSWKRYAMRNKLIPPTIILHPLVPPSKKKKEKRKKEREKAVPKIPQRSTKR